MAFISFRIKKSFHFLRRLRVNKYPLSEYDSRSYQFTRQFGDELAQQKGDQLAQILLHTSKTSSRFRSQVACRRFVLFI